MTLQDVANAERDRMSKKRFANHTDIGGFLGQGLVDRRNFTSEGRQAIADEQEAKRLQAEAEAKKKKGSQDSSSNNKEPLTKDPLQWISDALGGAYESLKGGLSKTWDDIKGIGSAIAKGAESLYNGMTNLWNDLTGPAPKPGVGGYELIQTASGHAKQYSDGSIEYIDDVAYAAEMYKQNYGGEVLNASASSEISDDTNSSGTDQNKDEPGALGKFFQKCKNFLKDGDFRTDEQRSLISKEQYKILKPALDSMKDRMDGGDTKLSTRMEYYGLKLALEGDLSNREMTDFENMNENYLKHVGVSENSGVTPLQFPMEAKGVKNYSNPSSLANGTNSVEDHKWSSYGTAMTILNAAEDWNKNNPDDPIYVNDLSIFGGRNSSLHSGSHLNQVDLKWMSDDGGLYGGNYNGPNADHYDQGKTVQFIDSLINNAPYGYEVDRILYGDYDVAQHFKRENVTNYRNEYVVRYEPNIHSNHLDVRVGSKLSKQQNHTRIRRPYISTHYSK